MKNTVLAIVAIFALAVSGCSYLEKSNAPAPKSANSGCCAAAKVECEAAKVECEAAKAECTAAQKQASLSTEN